MEHLQDRYETYPIALIRGLVKREEMTIEELADIVKIRPKLLQDINDGKVRMLAKDLIKLIMGMALTDYDLTMSIKDGLELITLRELYDSSNARQG